MESSEDGRAVPVPWDQAAYKRARYRLGTWSAVAEAK